MLPPLEIPDEVEMGEIVVPNAYTAQYNSLLTLLLNRDKKVGVAILLYATCACLFFCFACIRRCTSRSGMTSGLLYVEAA